MNRRRLYFEDEELEEDSPAEVRTGLLEQANRAPVKAGGGVRLPNTASQVLTYEFGFLRVKFPYDQVPAVERSKRPVDLVTSSERATTATIAVSYDAARNGEQVVSEQVDSRAFRGPQPIPWTYPREHRMSVTFGVGQARHTVEVDVTEGTMLNVPTCVVEAALLNYSAVFERPGQTAAMEEDVGRLDLISQGSMGYLPNSSAAVVTQRVWSPEGNFYRVGAGRSSRGSERRRQLFEMEKKARQDGEIRGSGAPFARVFDCKDDGEVGGALLDLRFRRTHHGKRTMQDAARAALQRLEAFLPRRIR